ncbi:acetylglutamate/acetylaminoadipate kinase [Blattabacterium sp. (Blatta orientalis) str. Tarazona]|uniref:acetylglutamate kinase n=1 Tax=Blattabacterium sp. (Blatta orientalis) TaxID=367806 RepID=UPI0002AD718A|nr:acetylglutamate kinase [Blattabacterium sp. (Blatta orientalis)]AGD98205.1 acetylglutamate/acetylaminoadipate kinase [Blattabacterium sp. (Blatta orientalis) str. Tarazona]
MKIHIVKIGGNLINDPKWLNASLESFLQLQGNKIFVHGGGSKANIIADKMGIVQKFMQGRRITDKVTLDLVVMTYAGIINKNIIAKFQSYDCNALGLCGADGNSIKSSFRLKKIETDIDYGYVGDINSRSVNTSFLKFLLKKKIVPVFCSITHNGKGVLLNTNADTIAACIAISLTKEGDEIELHFCFEKKGVLRYLHDAESYYKKIDFRLFQIIKKNHTIKNGMIPKLENAFFALKNGVSKVSIGQPYYLNDLNNKTVLCL